MRPVVSVESRSLLSQLRSEGLKTEVLHECGVSLVSLSRDTEYGPAHDKQTVYLLPPTLAGFSHSSLNQILRLYGAERGGGLSFSSTLICGASGRPLRPVYKVPEFGPEFSEVQAIFLLHGSGVSISVSRDSKKIVIHRHYIVLQNNGFVVLTTQVWRVGGSRLPKSLSGFDRAIKALKEKANSPAIGIFYADGVRKPGTVRRENAVAPVIV